MFRIFKKGVFIGLGLFASLNVHAATLNGTFFLPSGFATSDVEIILEVLELDATNSIANASVGNITVSANTGSTNYSLDYPDPAPGNNFTIRYFCTFATCGRFVNEVYYSPTLGTQFEFSNDTVFSNNQIPANLNFTLAVGTTVSGTIFLPRASNTELLITPVVQFVPNTVGRLATQIFNIIPITVPVGSTQIDFAVEGIPPIPGKLLVPFSSCSNCEPTFTRDGVVANFDPLDQAPTALPSNQNHTGVQLFHALGSAGAAVVSVIVNSLLLLE